MNRREVVNKVSEVERFSWNLHIYEYEAIAHRSGYGVDASRDLELELT